MKTILGLMLIFMVFLSGCSHTKVHLVTYGFDLQQRQNILKQFKDKGLDAEFSDATVPLDFPTVSLAMNPNYHDYETIALIDEILQSLNLTREQEFRFAQGRHFYSEKNLGLYIKNPAFKSQPMPPFLRTQYCESVDATVQFKPDGQFVIEYERKGTESEILHYQHGQYQFNGKLLELTSQEFPKFEYVLKKEQRDTYDGVKPADVFYPKNLLDRWPLAECELLIIYMYD